MIRLTAQAVTLDAAAGDQPSRTVSGIALPYGETAIVSDGTAVRFERGALPVEGKAPKLFMYHDSSQPVGLVTAREDTDAGMLFTARISATPAGDEALTLALDGVLDSVSVGVNPTRFTYDDDGTMIVQAADWIELSLVPVPAFSGAQITEVAAEAGDVVLDSEQEPDAEPTNQDTEESNVEASNPEVVVEAATVPTAPIFAQPKRELRLPSPGEYIAAMRRGGHDFAQLNANIQAATGDVLVSDGGGVLPTPVIGSVFTDVNAQRPIVSALGPKAMPEAGSSFIRPFVKVHSSAGVQSSELSALSTADFEVDDLSIAKKTFGGKLVLSEQIIDWSSPSMLDAAISDMAGQYALATENEVVSVMAAAVTNSQEVQISDFTDDAEFITDMYLAASSMASTGNYLPNALAVSPKRWASLGALVDGQGRPVFPQATPLSNIGTLPGSVTAWNGNPLGLNLVVSNQIKTQAVGNQDAEDYYWLINTRGIECYESYKGFLRDESVGTLGVTIAVRGYFAAAVIDVNMIRVLGPDATFS